MTVKRRDFLRLTATASSTLIAGEALASKPGNSESFDETLGVLVDTTFCIGCRKCEWACNQANKLPTQDIKSFEDKSVFQTRRRPTDSAYTIVNTYPDPEIPDRQLYIKLQCMHCLYPACASACIVGAFKKTPEGPVTYDAWKCMGCRYCIVACPFQIPAYEYNDAFAPRVMKCSFCFDKIQSDGKRPACVEICPNEALTYGHRKDILELAHHRIKQSPGRYVNHIYGENEAGGTSWMYLAGADFANTELPKIDSEPIPHNTEKIQHGIFKSFVPPLALYGLLALAMNSLKKRGKGDNHELS